METKTILLPNRPDTFLLQALRERLSQGQTVRITFGGHSMLPLIDGEGDSIDLAPLAPDQPITPGQVCLFYYAGHHIVHRLLKIKHTPNGDIYIFRGDNCYNCERVQRNNILALLTAVLHPDGTVIRCDSPEWIASSRRVVRRRTWKNRMVRLVNRQARKRLMPFYFLLLLILMWTPVGGLGVSLNNFVLGIRLDHLLHASVYLFCPLFLMDVLHYRKGLILLLAIAIGLCTESVQYLLPYRGFDINDLIANALGCTLCWLALLPYLRRKRGFFL